MSSILSRRDATLQTGYAAAFLTMGLTSRSFAQSSGAVINGLAREIDPLTRAMRGQTTSISDWREGLVEIYNRVDLADIRRDMDFEALAERTGYAERGVATAPVRMSLENGTRLSFYPKMFAVGRGRAIVPHGHDNMVSAHLTLSGQFHLRQYDKLAVENDALLIRQTVDEMAGPGTLSSISETQDNVHWFLATENAHTLDVVVMGLDPAAEQSFDIYNLDIDGASSEPGDILRAPRISVPDALRLYGYRFQTQRGAPMADTVFPTGELMKGKRGLVMGVANKNSIAWGIAQQLAAQGAELAFSYQDEALERRVRPLVESLPGNPTMVQADVTDDASMDACFSSIKDQWGTMDFLVHAIAFAGKDELVGSFTENTTREGWRRAMDISAFSFVDAGKRASHLMPNGGSMVTLTYLGSERVVPSYNVMGVAKAALEASTRYMARDLGPSGIRVNALSAGPMRTLAMAGISGGKSLMRTGREWSMMKEDTKMEGVAGAALYLLSDLGFSCTGETLHVDAGFHAVAVPSTDED